MITSLFSFFYICLAVFVHVFSKKRFNAQITAPMTVGQRGCHCLDGV